MLSILWNVQVQDDNNDLSEHESEESLKTSQKRGHGNILAAKEHHNHREIPREVALSMVMDMHLPNCIPEMLTEIRCAAKSVMYNKVGAYLVYPHYPLSTQDPHCHDGVMPYQHWALEGVDSNHDGSAVLAWSRAGGIRIYSTSMVRRPYPSTYSHISIYFYFIVSEYNSHQDGCVVHELGEVLDSLPIYTAKIVQSPYQVGRTYIYI